ncbi:MAG: multiheme c-type cytochrome [Thermodesulfobacteriota bacterium]
MKKRGSIGSAVLPAIVAGCLLLLWAGSSSAARMAPGPSKDPNTGKAYAGSETCKKCHAQKYSDWKNTIHAWMVRPIAKGDFKNVKADLTAEGAPKPDQYDWAYVIGGWYKEERYAFWDEKGNIIDGEFEYNKPKNHFSLRKKKDGSLSRLDWFDECGNCHATGVNYKERTFIEFNIGCEACHGPSADHAKAPKKVKAVIDTHTENCGRCHIRARMKGDLKKFNYPVYYELNKPETLTKDLDFEPYTAPGSFWPDQKNANRHRQQYLEWIKSPHSEVKGLSCATCHDPHKGSLSYRTGQLKGDERVFCGKCHEAIVANPKKHSGHRYDVASCSSCHMPYTIASGSIPNHTFEAIPPSKTLQYGVDEKTGKPKMPNSCGIYCHTKESAADLDVKYKAIFKKM